ncbi:MAG TPA: sigma-70 family RNA polymerase sigma factor [Thermotogota bacterium]|nr:sigma-70 family RNA polymerase sigma factor [Thermotogota bacterium]HQQ65271.1 sigma-70 family RNA polymerase sigma factor [Thermotogota bacterium]
MILYKLRKMRNEELVLYAQDGIEEAISLLVERYQNMVQKIANQYYGMWAEKSDIIQNGFVGLMKAIFYYKPDREANLNTFAWTNIHSEIKTFLTYLNRKKNKILTESYSFDYTSSEESDEEEPMMTMVFEQESEAVNLKDLLIEKTTERMKAALSEEEMGIFLMYTENYTYSEIAGRYGVNTKKVDNVIQKCRKSFKTYYEEEQIFLNKSEEILRRAV